MIIESAAEAAMFRPDKQLRFLDLAVWGEKCGNIMRLAWGLGRRLRTAVLVHLVEG